MKDKQTYLDNLEIPPHHRTVLALLPDTRQEVFDSVVKWRAVAASSPFIRTAHRGLQRVLLSPIMPPMFWPFKALLSDLLQFFMGPTQLVEGLMPMRISEAVRRYKFPFGRANSDQCYRLHPVLNDVYLPIERFHEIVFEEKYNQLITLLAGLGATRVRVEHQHGYGTEGGVSGEFDAGSAGKGGGGVSARQSGNKRATWEETFEPTKPAHVPDGLHWFDLETGWQSLARRRLEMGATSFKADLNYSEDFGVNAKFKAGLDSLGFEFSGDFKDFQNTSWSLEGSYV